MPDNANQISGQTITSQGVIYNVRCALDHYHQPVYNEKGNLESWLCDEHGPFHTIMERIAQWWLTVPSKDGWPIWCTAAKISKSFEQIGGAVPACTCATAITGFLKYYMYSGDSRSLDLARTAGDFLIQNALTPSHFKAFPRFPWPAGKTGDIHPDGSGHPHCSAGQIMPDKGAMAGHALLQLYKATSEKTYLEAAKHIARILITTARESSSYQTPWPFRADADTGRMIDGLVCANLIYAIMLLDDLAQHGLIRSRKKLARVKENAWAWLRDIAMTDTTGGKWLNFFEDHGGDENNATQFSALETAKYLLDNKEAADNQWLARARAIVAMVIQRWTVHDGSYIAIGEQDRDMSPYNSHTARLAAVLARLYEAGFGDSYKSDAYSALAYAAYSVNADGFADTYYLHDIAWTTDSFGDLIVHFVEALAAIPAWAPSTQNHILRSTSVLSGVLYGTNSVSYSAFDAHGTEMLKLVSKPMRISEGRKCLDTWSWNECDHVLIVTRHDARQLVITL